VFRAWLVTAFPVLFLIILFGGGSLFQKRNIDMDGDPPIARILFYSSKYLIVIIWVAMVLQSWGIYMSIVIPPSPVSSIAIILWVVGFSLLLIGRFGMGNSFRIGSPKESTSLRVVGLFKFSRNPMYLGVFATLLASVLYTLNPIIPLIAIFIVVVHHKIVLAEEEYLRNVFGEEYQAYCGRVRRYL
jgi:protein-S-isoprenylcysteine O-methyltransferase Ste14